MYKYTYIHKYTYIKAPNRIESKLLLKSCVCIYIYVYKYIYIYICTRM